MALVNVRTSRGGEWSWTVEPSDHRPSDVWVNVQAHESSLYGCITPQAARELGEALLEAADAIDGPPMIPFGEAIETTEAEAT